MSAEKVYKLTDFELDQLKEIINIGTGNASTALNQLVNKRVGINVFEASVGSVEQAIDSIGQPESVVTSILLRLVGDANGLMLFVFPDDTSQNLIKMVTKNRILKEFLTEYDRSVLREVGNILAGACSSAFSKFLGINLLHSVSEVATDTIGAIMSSVLAEIGKFSNVAIIFKINMTIEEEAVGAQLFFLLDPSFTSQVNKAIKEKYLAE